MTTTTTTDLTAVMDRIAKIRELASRGGTPHEAEVAAAKMADLLLRYNLTLSDVDAHAQKTGRRVVTEDYEMDGQRWMIDLLFAVADAHLCKGIHTRGATKYRKAQMQVVGHEHNLIVVRETWPWLCKEIGRLARAACKAAIAAGDLWAEDHPGTWQKDFKVGAVVGVRAAYRAMRQTVQAEVAAQWAIVPVLQAEVETRFAELFPTLGKLNRQSVKGINAFAAGQAAGRAINLGRQVGGSANVAIAS